MQLIRLQLFMFLVFYHLSCSVLSPFFSVLLVLRVTLIVWWPKSCQDKYAIDPPPAFHVSCFLPSVVFCSFSIFFCTFGIKGNFDDLSRKSVLKERLQDFVIRLCFPTHLSR